MQTGIFFIKTEGIFLLSKKNSLVLFTIPSTDTAIPQYRTILLKINKTVHHSMQESINRNIYL